MTFDWTVTIPSLLAIGSMIYAHFRTRGLDLKGRLSAGDEQFEAHELRIQSLEIAVRSLPSKEDLHTLHLDIAKIGGALGRMEAVMEGNAKIMQRLETIVSRHEDHLLSGAKK